MPKGSNYKNDNGNKMQYWKHYRRYIIMQKTRWRLQKKSQTGTDFTVTDAANGRSLGGRMGDDFTLLLRIFMCRSPPPGQRGTKFGRGQFGWALGTRLGVQPWRRPLFDTVPW
jgi:hypothetical protein